MLVVNGQRSSAHGPRSPPTGVYHKLKCVPQTKSKLVHNVSCCFIKQLHKCVPRVPCVPAFSYFFYIHSFIFKFSLRFNLTPKIVARSGTHRVYADCRPILVVHIVVHIVVHKALCGTHCSFFNQLLYFQPVSTRHSGSFVSDIWQWPLTTDN